MVTKDSRTIKKKPIHIHKGKNYLRTFSLILLIGITGLTVISFFFHGFIFFPALIGGLFGVFCIRYPRLYIFEKELLIEKKGLLTKFNDQDVFKYEEIESVKFSKGFTDWTYLVVISLFGSGGFGGNNKADQIIIKTKNQEVKIYNRFGKRKDFKSTIEMINKKLRPFS